MPSKTLLLAAFLLAIMSLFQEIVALPASSTSSLVPESTALGGPEQATPTADLSLASPSNSTSETHDSESHLSPRGGPVPPYVQFYSDPKCKGSQIGSRLTLNNESCHHIDDGSANAPFMNIYWDPAAGKKFTFCWYNMPLCAIHLSPEDQMKFRDGYNTTILSGGFCWKRPEEEMHSVNYFYGTI